MQDVEIDKVKAELKEKYSEQDDQRTAGDDMTKKIEEKNEKITECYKKKDSLKDEYWKMRFEAREQNDEIIWIDWLNEEKECLVSSTKEREAH